MKRLFKGIIISILIIAVLATLTACNDYKWDAVGSKDYSDQAAVGNGSLSVQQGSYLYFVNGLDDDSTLSSKSDNAWGNASVKGNIMKSKINDDGTLECLGILIPKMFYSDYASAGIYVYGEWIYYVSRSVKTDNQGALISALEYMRTKIDGTKTQSICIVEDLTSPYLFTENGLIYGYDSDLHYVSYTNKKVGKDTVVVEDYTDAEISKEDCCVFYTIAASNTYIKANKLGVINNAGAANIIINDDSYYAGTGTYYEDLSTQYTLAIIGYNAEDNSLYYTKTCNDAKAAAGTYGYKFGDSYAFDKANEKQFAKSALTSINCLGFDKGIIDVAAAEVKIYAPMTTTSEIVTSETFSSTISILFMEESNNVNYTYYVMSNGIYRTDLLNTDGSINSKADEEKISDSTVITTWGNPTKIGEYIYFISSDDSSYLFRFDYKTFVCSDNSLVKPESYIVSGYKAYTYQDDDDFVLNKDDESIKDKVPAYMTESETTTYITNHQTANK